MGADYLPFIGIDPVFTKKYWLIWKLIDAYRWFFVVDAEVEIIGAVDLSVMATQIFHRKMLFGAINNRRPLVRIIKDAMRRYNVEEVKVLMNQTKAGELYVWFNEVPVFEAESVRAFLSDTRLGILDPKRFYKNEFDAMVYQYFLVLNYGWSIVDVTHTLSQAFIGNCKVSVGECGGGSVQTAQLIQPHWALHKAWGTAREKFNGFDIFMTFHNDRDNSTDSLNIG